MLIFYQALKHLVTCNGHMITVDEERLEKGLIRTCIRTRVQQTRKKKTAPGRAKFGTLRRSLLVSMHLSSWSWSVPFIESKHGLRLNNGHMYSLAL